MRVVVFSPDVPYPPNRGGRADVWRRIEAMVRSGHHVMLVNLQEPTGPLAPSAGDLAQLDAVVSVRFSFPIKRSVWRTLRQLVGASSIPWHAATRIPGAGEAVVLEKKIKEFQPDFLWLDGPWFGSVAETAAEKFGAPILYRSHNIEHLYLARQARSAVRLRDKLAWRLACVGLERFESRLIQRASAVFDISVDDLQYWTKRGVTNIHWLPPLPELAFKTSPSVVIQSDILFVGNLGTPNNVRGVEWLVQEILPRVRALRADTKCLIVGSNPTAHVRRLIDESCGASLCENVPDVLPYLFGAKVLVNPVRSGSGVQVKMLDMLMTDAPIVTATQGTRGLPEEMRDLFCVADDADIFADAVCRELASPTVDLFARLKARAAFSIDAVSDALQLAARTAE